MRQTTLDAFHPSPRPPRSSMLGASYAVRGLTDDERAEHARALTMVPKTFGPAKAQGFDAYRVDGATLHVPRHYGRLRFGPADVDARHDGLPLGASVRFAGTLNPDQQRAHDACEAALREHGGCVQIRRTGGGKTVLGIRMAVALGRRTCVFVHKGFLVQQWEERIRAFAPAATIGRIQQHKADVDADFVIAMVQTVVKRGYDLSAFGLCICDEAHHMGARMFFSVLGLAAPRFWLGLTATPERNDGLTRLLEYGIGPMVVTDAAVPSAVPASASASASTSSSSDGSAPEVVHVTVVSYSGGERRERKTRTGDLNLALMINDLCDDPHRTRVVASHVARLHGEGHHVLVLSDRLAHLEAICEMAQQQPPSSAADAQPCVPAHDVGFLRASTPARERHAVTERRVLMASYSMAREALDVSTLSAVVFATPVGSIVQAIGRVTRPNPTKKTPVQAVDVSDDFSMFVWLGKKRLRTYREKGYPVRHVGVE